MRINMTLTSKLNYCFSRILQYMAYRTNGAFGRPTSAIVLLTNRCNARCVHCHSWMLPQSEEMTMEDWKKFFCELRKWVGQIFISVTGGETLLREDAIEIVRYAAQLGFWVECLTNGYLLDPIKAEALVKSGVNRIKISLDASQAKIHDDIRGKKGFFEKAVWALKTLAQEKERSKQDIQIWAKTAIMSLNAEDLANIAILVRDLGVEVEFQALEPVYYSKQLGDHNWYKNNPLWITDLNKLSHTIQKLKELKTQGYPIVNSTEGLDLIENYFRDPDALSYRIHSHDYNKKKRECRSWFRGLQIMPDGGMKMCHWMQPFANAKEGEIQKSWNKRVRCWMSPCQFSSYEI